MKNMMKNIKFVIIILMIFFGVGIMAEINDYDYSINKTGVMYQENDNIVLNENNRYYDYDIDFNLDESYLHYSPVKKAGLLDSLNIDKNKNLALPDLTGKEYLGNGEYSIHSYLTYNIYSGVYTLNKNDGFSGFIDIRSIDNTLGDITLQGWVINGVEQSKLDIFVRIPNNPYVVIGYGVSYHYVSKTLTTESVFSIYLDESDTFNNFQFKVQIEKGTIATPYQVPYIPPLQIAFNGSNQVEYINPFEEQIIEINDINNVNNIEFELLNTTNPVVYNWNITTNPNMPFVRFYNNQTKLLYDFTNVKEMNNIGNNIVGSRSNFQRVFNGAIDLIDFFYQGFQKIFSKKNIVSLWDNLKNNFPLLPPTWPWLRS